MTSEEIKKYKDELNVLKEEIVRLNKNILRYIEISEDIKVRIKELEEKLKH